MKYSVFFWNLDFIIFKFFYIFFQDIMKEVQKELEASKKAMSHLTTEL
jgi:hypothetical protein